MILNYHFILSQSIDVNIRGYIANFTSIVYMFSNAIAQSAQVIIGPKIAKNEIDDTGLYKLASSKVIRATGNTNVAFNMNDKTAVRKKRF